MTAGSADQNGPSGEDVVFTLGRGYRRPQRNRGAAFAVLAAVAAVVAGRRTGADVAWGFAAAFGALALGYAARYALMGGSAPG